ncbi:helix-turn-helix domain-containing protein [Vibrio pectenicida]|uniref:Helix-turn-helix domain-containing protein n=2 Tax=Vibrio pectenicida TaxID=62763 RepID=A0A7Y4EEW1_9VIBR|nr:helix-turn-helix domain-containing protein [Vibrio pectenicida]
MNGMKIGGIISQFSEETWIGESTFIQLTKQRLKSMAASTLPVLITGKTGTGKKIAAEMLHDFSDRKSHPLIEVRASCLNKANLINEVVTAIQKASGGSVYLTQVELLDQGAIDTLVNYWPRFENIDPSVRLLVSTSISLPIDESQGSNKWGEKGSLLNRLYYNCLNLELPTLNERQNDINALVEYYQSLDPKLARLSIQKSAWQVLFSYEWPKNVKQLKRCLDKLAIQGETTLINREVLLDCFPMMGEINVTQQRGARMLDLTPKPRSLRGEIGTTSTVMVFPTKELDTPKNTHNNATILHNAKSHPGLNKAIRHLYNNFTLPLTMDELANHACMSPSHLSYLFKVYLGMSFKQVLLRLRIVRAMGILSENPNRHVTQVCDDVGFSDLSFFVRKFKSIVGISPGAYRDQFSHTETSQELIALVDDLAHPLLQP